MLYTNPHGIQVFLLLNSSYLMNSIRTSMKKTSHTSVEYIPPGEHYGDLYSCVTSPSPFEQITHESVFYGASVTPRLTSYRWHMTGRVTSQVAENHLVKGGYKVLVITGLFNCRLFNRWRGSVFKLIWPDLIVYLVLYGMVSLVYRFALSEEQKRIFEKMALSCEYFRNVFPISFVLGFYVTIVVQRWWAQYMLIPWPDTICLLANTYIQGQDDRARMIRKNFARYINLAFALSFSRISPRVARRFPTYQHFIEAARSLFLSDIRVGDNFHLRVSWEVVTMATYSYFGFAILGRQFLDTSQGYEKHKIDFYVPIFTLLQFIFYVGWLKVAESLLNPFGDDDDDFDTCDFLDRHFEVSYMIVDVMHKSYPETLNNYWDNSSFQLATVSSACDHQGYKNSSHSKKSQNSQKNSKQEKLSPVIKYYMESPGTPSPRGLQSPSAATPRTRGQRSRCNQTYNRVNACVGTQDDLPPSAVTPNDHPPSGSPGSLHTTRVYIPAINDHLGGHDGALDATPVSRDLPDHPEDDPEISTVSRSCSHQYTNGGFLSK
ncbi:bestrophin-1-like [Penaeus chinensis]|uniref:bestrophin-1-like n=1 Tax=Penaeus chinensis TaxID=139456 RepID=UPI001FB57775|nr:bestrophin-1-like [Penaeus chinensis]